VLDAQDHQPLLGGRVIVTIASRLVELAQGKNLFRTKEIQGNTIIFDYCAGLLLPTVVDKNGRQLCLPSFSFSFPQPPSTTAPWYGSLPRFMDLGVRFGLWQSSLRLCA
jgi:hypothetical protein